MYKLFYKNVIYPLHHSLKRDNVWAATKELRVNQRLSLPELKRIQAQKLYNLLLHSIKSVPYYKNIFSIEKKILSEGAPFELLKRLPLITKKIIRENISSLISDDLTGNKLIKNSTSGSTGESLFFYNDTRSSAYRRACLNRNMEWADFFLGDKQVKLWGAPMDITKTQTIHGRFHAALTRMITLSSYDLSPLQLDKYIKTIIKFSPKLILSYPGPLEVLANHINNKKFNFPSVRSIITSAEQLYPHQRELFEKVFGAKVFNRYGCREFGDVAQECEFGSGLHVSIDRFLVEILDDKGRETPPGELGELYITDLDNYGMPMIRYQIGDMAAWAKEQSCPCNRPLPLLSRIEGRSLDVIKAPNNNKLGGTFWTLLLRSKPGIRQFQLTQEDIKGITIRYVPDSNFRNNVLEYFTKEIEKKCGTNFKIAFQETATIEKTTSGKQKIIVSHV